MSGGSKSFKLYNWLCSMAQRYSRLTFDAPELKQRYCMNGQTLVHTIGKVRLGLLVIDAPKENEIVIISNLSN